MNHKMLALFSVLLLVGCSESDPPTEPPTETIESPHPGQAIYEGTCATCHDDVMPRTPHVALLEKMTPDAVYKAMTQGMMTAQSSDLSDDDKRAVAEYLTQSKIGENQAGANIPLCTVEAFDPTIQPHVRDWGMDYARTRYQSLENAGLGDTAMENLEVAWTIALPHTMQMRSQPGFAGGLMLFGSQDGTVYGLDAKTGCQHWTFSAFSEVRTGVAVSSWEADDASPTPMAVFGDHVGNFYGLNAITGKQIWRARPHDHPHAKISGTPRIIGDRVIVTIASHEDSSAADPDYPCCTFRGAVAMLDLKTGETIWISYTIPDEAKLQGTSSVGTKQYGSAGASVWNTASIDLKRSQIYVGTGNNYASPGSGTSDSVLALDLDTGAIKWVYQGTSNDRWNTACMAGIRGPNCPENEGPDFDMGAGTLITTDKNGRDVVVSGQKSSTAHGIDPDTGIGIWRNTLGRGGIQGGIHFGLAAHDGVAYIPNSDMIYDGDAAVYTVAARPGLFALDIANGDIIWAWEPTEDTCQGRQFCDPGVAAPPTIFGDYVMANALDGWVRVHNRHTGEIVWSMDTTQAMTGINGVEGHGGSMNGAGPVAYDGQIYIMSGYAYAGHMAGNLLIVLKEATSKAASEVESEVEDQ
ncbi:MAG: pyrrolo-quinoline quinone [Alphaproteobacteria bacterium]|nr:MAG: pyrrolo-quinoline quinone [Alphaproteobacteria bacterium]